MRNAILVLIAVGLLTSCENSQLTGAIKPKMMSAGWERWSKNPGAVFAAPNHIASDPAVIADEPVFRLIYTGVDFSNPAGPRSVLSMVTSVDSLAWAPIPSPASATVKPAGEILRGREGAWDEDAETPWLMKTASGYFLYYSGYKELIVPGGPGKGFPAAVGLASSRDGVTFARVKSDPVLSPTAGGFDSDAIYSPDVIPYQDGYLMVYAGHCYKDCPGAPGVRILAATSPDGIHWTKVAQPVLAASAADDWMRDGVAEPAMVVGPDGNLYLFFTGVRAAERVIGVARAATLAGPWEIDPEPIVTPTAGSFDETGDMAPSVLLESGVVRLWFVGTNQQRQYAIGYAEAPWPLRHTEAKPTGPVFAVRGAVRTAEGAARSTSAADSTAGRELTR